MTTYVEPSVELCGYHEFRLPGSLAGRYAVDPQLDGWDGVNLPEFAGRACYQSWSKPNPATASNAGYLAHILQVGHLSVLEHSFAAFYVTGVSRSFTHELVRHRHLQFSQLSQRYVNESDAAMVLPEIIGSDLGLSSIFEEVTAVAQSGYDRLVAGLEEKLLDVPDRTMRRKIARQAARAVLPNATETRIVVSGNYRAWRHFINLRATEHADVEIRAVAMGVLNNLRLIAGNVVADYVDVQLEDGSFAARSPYVETP